MPTRTRFPGRWVSWSSALLSIWLSVSTAVGEEGYSLMPPAVEATRGTLFLWGSAPDETGGPDLSEPLVTDRPDFTEASVTVGRDVTQLEFGYTFSHDDEDDTSTRTHSFGEPLLRQGMFADWFELRLALFPVQERTGNAAGSDTTAGLEDLYIGCKFALTPQAGFLPEMALVTQATVPTGSSNFSGDEFLPGVNWLYSWDVTEEFSLAGSTQFNRSVDEAGPPAGGRETYTEWAQSLSAGYSLTDDVGAYSEWFAFFPHSAPTAETQHYYNGGFTWLITDDVQWDIRAGCGLNSAADDFFTGTGLSVRFR